MTLKYGRMVYFGEMGGSKLVAFNSLSEAQEGRHPDARGKGAHGPIYELTGRIWYEENETITKWSEGEVRSK